MNGSEAVTVGIIFSDLVIREAGTGKYTLVGIFNNYRSNFFPFVIPNFFVTVLISNLKGKHEHISVSVQIENSKTKLTSYSVAGGVMVKPGAEFNGHETIEIPFPIQQCVISEVGVYSVVVLLEGKKIGERPFEIGSLSESNQS